MFPDLVSARFRPRRYRPGGVGNWSGHLPFAADLIHAARPSLLVELGTHYGESYFGFCQAINEQRSACRAYAVDSWLGDTQSGSYGPEVFEDVSAYNAAHYDSFSSLLRMTFDEASRRFADASIDLLHLDGCHTYAALKHDFETWLPKVVTGGIILIHDITVRQGDFGAWQFWEEISKSLPSFAFHHSHGLGVIANGSATQFANPFLQAIFENSSNSQNIRDYYVMCAERLHYAYQATIEPMTICQAFSPNEAGYCEERSATTALPRGEWVEVAFDLPAPEGRLRLDPVSCSAIVEISDVAVECPRTGTVLWRFESSRLDEISCSGTAVRIPDDDRLTILSYDTDPQLYLPDLSLSETTGPIRCRARFRIDGDPQVVRRLVEKYQAAETALIELRSEVEQARAAR